MQTPTTPTIGKISYTDERYHRLLTIPRKHFVPPMVLDGICYVETIVNFSSGAILLLVQNHITEPNECIMYYFIHKGREKQYVHYWGEEHPF